MKGNKNTIMLNCFLIIFQSRLVNSGTEPIKGYGAKNSDLYS